MKVNFWQVLGIILMVVGVAFYMYEKSAKSEKPAPTNTTTPTTHTAS